MDRVTTYIVGATALIAGFSPAARADWSDDPTTNLSVADGPGSQMTPIVRAAADGGVWIYFYDNSVGTGLKPVVQRLTPWGDKVFAGNGVVLADRHNTASFTADMKVDTAGNAYAAFDDDSTARPDGAEDHADGSPPWGRRVQMPAATARWAPHRTARMDTVWVASSATCFSFSGSTPMARLWRVRVGRWRKRACSRPAT